MIFDGLLTVKGAGAGRAQVAIHQLSRSQGVLVKGHPISSSRAGSRAMASTRRLTAIIAVDVAGYSRLMEADEEGTHERLKAHFRELVHPKITEHRGRIVKNTGDGFLPEFSSVVDAVRCAVELQYAMSDRNTGTDKDKRITFRVGVNLGDVIAEDDDIYGDRVNIAARLEALAEPGGICISRTVRDQIRDKLPYPFEDRGELSVKNIARPVRVYELRPETVAALPMPNLPLAPPEARQQQVQDFENLDAQLDLFQAAFQAAARSVDGSNGVGRRPLAAHSSNTDEAAQVYITRHGDPLEMGVAISALPILSDGVLEKLRRILGFDRKSEAARFWLEVYSATMPFIHHRSTRLIVRPPGGSDVERASWIFRDDANLVDLTPNSVAHEAAAKKSG
jgi:class 3 adenylate cyclase